MNVQKLKAEVRRESGKGPSRQLRKQGLIPAVFYGPGKKLMNLAVSPEALAKLVGGPYGRNQLIELEIGNEKELAVVRDLAVDPVTRSLLHADFYSVSLDRPVRTKVPFVTKGRALGVQKGGRLRIVFRELPVTAKPDKVPASIEVDVSHLDTAQSIRVKDIALPEGAQIDYSPERVLVAIDAKEKEKPEEAAAGASGAAAGTTAAPAGSAQVKAAQVKAGGKDAKATAKEDKKKK
jgi:large subunit ribosomal protein L25